MRPAGWTGGQYSLVRVLLALVLGAALLAQAATAGPSLLQLVGLPALVLLGLGRADRGAALLLAVCFALSAHAAEDSLARTSVLLWLLAHAGLPSAPWGSLAAKGREDPGSAWTMPPWFPALGLALLVGTRLALAFSAGPSVAALFLVAVAGLALAPSTRALAWALSLGFDLALGLTGGGSIVAALMVHAFALRPEWIPPREGRDSLTVYYDGTCALCHGAVRFLLAEDRLLPSLRIAPLGGETFSVVIGEAERATLPDSIVVDRGDGRLLVRSDAVLALLAALGGLWRAVAWAIALLPGRLRDAAYDAVAARRFAWFGRRSDACPLAPPQLRGRISA